jgi:hypothetical protein
MMTGRRGFFHIYKPPKNLLKLTTSELPLEPVVLVLLVRLGEEEEEEEEVDMRVARSSYLAWDSRGSWPKRPKAHGAAVDVGNREKEEAILEREDDIYVIWFCGVGGDDWGDWVGLCVWRWGGVGKMRPWRGTPIPRVLISAHLDANFDSGTVDYNGFGRSFVLYQE